jgi:hypothetical protein
MITPLPTNHYSYSIFKAINLPDGINKIKKLNTQDRNIIKFNLNQLGKLKFNKLAAGDVNTRAVALLDKLKDKSSSAPSKSSNIFKSIFKGLLNLLHLRTSSRTIINEREKLIKIINEHKSKSNNNPYQTLFSRLKIEASELIHFLNDHITNLSDSLTKLNNITLRNCVKWEHLDEKIRAEKEFYINYLAEKYRDYSA